MLLGVCVFFPSFSPMAWSELWCSDYDVDGSANANNGNYPIIPPALKFVLGDPWPIKSLLARNPLKATRYEPVNQIVPYEPRRVKHFTRAAASRLPCPPLSWVSFGAFVTRGPSARPPHKGRSPRTQSGRKGNLGETSGRGSEGQGAEGERVWRPSQQGAARAIWSASEPRGPESRCPLPLTSSYMTPPLPLSPLGLSLSPRGASSNEPILRLRKLDRWR